MQVVDVGPGVGTSRLEALDVLPHVPQPDRINRRHANRHGQLGVGLAERRLQLDVLLHQPLAALVVGLSQGRQLERPLGAVDELPPEPRFQLADHPAHRRLRPPVRLRRLREAAEIDQVTEQFQRFQLHVGKWYYPVSKYQEESE